MRLAASFDAPVHSEVHADLRGTAWMGGSQAEGPYVLGMLIGENFFKSSFDEYVRRLHRFVSAKSSESAADTFCANYECHHLVPSPRYPLAVLNNWP